MYNRHSLNSEINITEVSAISAFQSSILKEDSRRFTNLSNLDDKFDILKTNEHHFDIDDGSNNYNFKLDQLDHLNISMTPPKNMFGLQKQPSEIKLDKEESNYNLPSLDNIDINVDSNQRKMFFLSKKSGERHWLDSSSNLFSNISSSRDKRDDHDLNESSFSLPKNITISVSNSPVSVGLGNANANAEESLKAIDEYVKLALKLFNYFLVQISHQQ